VQEEEKAKKKRKKNKSKKKPTADEPNLFKTSFNIDAPVFTPTFPMSA